MKKVNFNELEKMSYEEGVKTILAVGYVQTGSGVEHRDDGIDINDEYYNLFDETGEEIHCVSYVTYTRIQFEDEPLEVNKDKWHWSEIPQ